jgi:uncharacterized protein (TIGR02996 family)
MRSEVEAFLKRILACPDDDAPRLIFADWLEENVPAPSRSAPQSPPPVHDQWGADRGKFIRIQIAIAKIREEEAREIDESGWADRRGTRDEMLELEREEQHLYALHRDEWEAPFDGLAPVFRRGFVEEVLVPAPKLVRQAHELFAQSPLRHVRIHDIGESLHAVFKCSHLSRINELTVNAQHKREILARVVAASEQLVGLERLHLTRNDFEDEATIHIATSKTLVNLRELDLSDNHLGETSAQVLAASANLSGLRVLELGMNRLGPVGAETIAASDRFGKLHRLGLSGNQIGTARVHTLSQPHVFFRVPVLDLSHNEVGVVELQALLNRAPRLPAPETNRLRQLDLSGNPLGDNGTRVLAVCPHLENLQVLRLANCNITDEGVRILAASAHLNNLVELDLSRNPISDSGCRALLDPPHLAKLKRPITPMVGISSDTIKRLDNRYRDRMY